VNTIKEDIVVKIAKVVLSALMIKLKVDVYFVVEVRYVNTTDEKKCVSRVKGVRCVLINYEKIDV
jgi:hypothetical protein